MTDDRPPAAGESEVDLVEAAAAGDHVAFMTLYERYDAYIRSRTWQTTYPHEHDLREDVTQVVWTRLLCGKWRPSRDVNRRDLRPFLKAIVRTVTFNCRQANRIVGQQKTAVVIDDALTRLLRAPAVDLDQLLIDEQNLWAIHLALGILTPLQRKALRLRYEENLANRDIGARLGVADVSKLLCKARRRICDFVGVEYLADSERITRKTDRTLREQNFNRKRRLERARARREAAA